MAGSITNRAWRPSAPELIDADLTALWREVARAAPVSRAVMSNLVVFCRCPTGDDLDLTAPPEGLPIEEVAGRHPARVILLHHDPGAPEGNAGQGLLAAHVGVVTFGPPEARYGVEQIVIRAACSETALPSIVRRLTLGDVPTSIWWTEDLSETPPLAPIVSMGRQFLYDSRRWRDVRTAVLALAPLLTDTFGPDLADINWRRLMPVRQALVHAIGSSAHVDRPIFASVNIRHRAGEAALAWLLVGWLVACEASNPDALVNVQEDSDLGDDVLTASFGDEFQLRLGRHQVSVVDPLGPAPFVVPVPREEEAEAVVAELRSLTDEVSFRDALVALVRRFSGG